MKTILDPRGRTWTVRRRPERLPRWRRPDADWWSLDGGGLGADDLAGMAVGIALVVLAAVAIFFVLPAILFLLDLVLLAAALLLFGAPWRVEAATPGPPADSRAWRVRGIRASGRAVDEVAAELARGDEAEPEDAEP